MLNLITYVFVGLGIILGIVAIKCCFLEMRAKKNEIASTLEALSQFNQGEYAVKFEDISRIMSSNRAIADVWQDFRKTLTKQKSVENDMDELFSPVEAGEIINYSSVVKDIDVNFWQNFGGIFTGLGILGTFAGLTVGLMNVDLSSSDVSVLKEGIGNLLGGISTAFYTSLFGIGAALIYGALFKYNQDGLVKVVGELAERIEEMFPRKTTEQWLADGNRESIQQTKALKNLAQAIAESLNEILDKQLSAGFDELCDKLEEQLKPTFEKLYEAIAALNDGGANAIAGAVSEKAGAQLNSFAELLQNMQETMKESLVNSERTSAQANQMMITTMQQIASSLSQGTDEAVRKQQEATEQMSQQMQNLVLAFNQSSEQAMNNMLTASSTAQQGLNDTIERTRESTRNMFDSFKEILDKQANVLIESMETNNKKVDGIVRLLQETIDRNNETLGQSYVAVKEMAQTTLGMLESVKMTGKTMEQSVAPIIEATEALKRELETVQNQTEKLHEDTMQQIDKLTTHSQKTEQSMQKLSEVVESAEKKAVDAWDTYKDGLVNMDNELSVALDKIMSNITQYTQLMNEGMQTQLSGFDKSISTVVSSLKTVIDDLNDMVDDLLDYEKNRKN